MTNDLYQDAIKQLARAETGAGVLDNPDATVTVDNPLCGDRVTISLRIEGEKVAALGHRVRGCLLCQAAASLLAQAAVGAPVRELVTAQQRLQGILTGAGAAQPPGDDKRRGDEAWEQLAVFQPVAGHKSRHRCVLLPFEAAVAALGPVNTN